MLILRYLRMCLVLTALIIISSIPIPTYSQEKCLDDSRKLVSTFVDSTERQNFRLDQEKVTENRL